MERGLAAWAAAAARAPDDGAEEAAYHLFEERALFDAERREATDPVVCLKLSAALGFAPAVRQLERARQRAKSARLLEGVRRREARFVRNDKARAWTAAEERSERYM